MNSVNSLQIKGSSHLYKNIANPILAIKQPSHLQLYPQWTNTRAEQNFYYFTFKAPIEDFWMKF